MSEKIAVQIDPDLEDLIPGFLQNRRNDIDAVSAALAAGELDKIRVIGHSMKGAGGGYGFDAITDIGASMEEAALAEDPDAIKGCVGQLEDYLARVEVTYG